MVPLIFVFVFFMYLWLVLTADRLLLCHCFQLLIISVKKKSSDLITSLKNYFTLCISHTFSGASGHSWFKSVSPQPQLFRYCAVNNYQDCSVCILLVQQIAVYQWSMQITHHTTVQHTYGSQICRVLLWNTVSGVGKKKALCVLFTRTFIPTQNKLSN